LTHHPASVTSYVFFGPCGKCRGSVTGMAPKHGHELRHSG
jgi:hypothetical protein